VLLIVFALSAAGQVLGCALPVLIHTRSGPAEMRQVQTVSWVGGHRFA